MGKRKTPIPFPQCGELIRKYRKLRDYSIADLARHINMDPKYLSTIESSNARNYVFI